MIGVGSRRSLHACNPRVPRIIARSVSATRGESQASCNAGSGTLRAAAELLLAASRMRAMAARAKMLRAKNSVASESKYDKKTDEIH